MCFDLNYINNSKYNVIFKRNKTMATIQHKVSYTRANAETPFFHAYEGKSTDMSALSTHIKTNFEDTAKTSKVITTTSSDFLTHTVTRRFKDEATLNEFLNDATVSAFITERNNYCNANGITKDIEVSQQDDLTF